MKNIFTFLFLLCLLNAGLSVKAQVPVMNSYPSASATLFLDFDGHVVNGTPWNVNGPISCAPSNLTNAQAEQIFLRVAEDYRPFNINITTDSTVYWAAPPAKRMRIVLTTTSSWYGSAGGVAYIGSFVWGDNTPCFVFTQLLNLNTKYIAEATSHELGHTLGLRHQSSYDANCYKTAEYNPGTGNGEIAWAPIMGVGYYRNFTLWNNGANPYGCTNFQDDLGIITSATNGFGYRTDDHSNSDTGATMALITNNLFDVKGIIESESDQDYFKIHVLSTSNFHLDASPYNLGDGMLGSNLDMEVNLYGSNLALIGSFNPQLQLNANIDTMLNPGIYYLRVQGKGNQFAPQYASLGSYSLKGILAPVIPLPLYRLELRGTNRNNQHQFDWVIDADETVVQQQLEVSPNGVNYEPVANFPTALRTYSYLPMATSGLYYRLNVKFDNGHQYYSNVVSLRSITASRPTVITNPVQNTLTIKTNTSLQYEILDYSGRMASRGKFGQGMYQLNIGHLSAGMYLIRFTNGLDVYVEKFIRQ